MKKNVKSIILTAAILMSGAVLIVVGILRSNLNFYTTIDQVKKGGGAEVRVLGEVVPGSWKSEATMGSYTFTLTDKKETLPVRYTGAPVTISPGRQIVVEGRLAADGTFQAAQILTKCESRYSGRSGGAVNR